MRKYLTHFSLVLLSLGFGLGWGNAQVPTSSSTSQTLASSATAAAPATPLSTPAPIGSVSTNQYPYSMAGQLLFSSGDSFYQGSGTAVFSRSVLTAAHNLWDADTGWSTGVEFNRARSGADVATRTVATRLFVFAGYQSAAARFSADSVAAFSNDLGGLRFATPVANGAYAGWRFDLHSLSGDLYNIALGYGAETHSGDEMLFVEPQLGYFQVANAFFENDSLMFEGGMSGGPVFAEVNPGDLRIVGVIVAGSDNPPSGAIRAINAPAARFIQTYLHY